MSDDAREQWTQKLAAAGLDLAPPVNAEVLADRFGTLESDQLDELCNEAAMACISAGESAIAMEHFETAAEDVLETEAGSEDSDTSADAAGRGTETDASDFMPAPAADDDDDETEPDDDDNVQDDETGVDETVADPAAMERDALEDEVHTLRSEVDQLRNEVDKLQEVANRDLAIMKGAMVNLLDVDDIEALPAASEDLRETIAETRQEVSALDGVITDGGGGKEGKVAQIVQLAANRRTDEDIIKLSAKNIVDATGVSRRYAYDLMDPDIDTSLPNQYDWVLAKDDLRQYGDVEMDLSSQAKCIGIDFNGTRSDGCPVNKFTTRSE